MEIEHRRYSEFNTCSSWVTCADSSLRCVAGRGRRAAAATSDINQVRKRLLVIYRRIIPMR
ncbi:hypothetical protein E2C01_013302 [Portunus trituberculatus]|uniref:Uncharacterized protein n=1 Tax=Portunus trituberculatus TaxID=210409 RepID=A0A5B7DGA5_PORTR|nr:hypothetical protein [Portunus trituberculatus]